MQQSVDPSKLVYINDCPEQSNQLPQNQFRIFSRAWLQKYSFPYPSTAASKRACLKYGIVMYMAVLTNHFDQMKASPEHVFNIVDEIEYWYYLTEKLWIIYHQNILSNISLIGMSGNWSKLIQRQGASLKMLTDINGYHT